MNASKSSRTKQIDDRIKKLDSSGFILESFALEMTQIEESLSLVFLALMVKKIVSDEEFRSIRKKPTIGEYGRWLCDHWVDDIELLHSKNSEDFKEALWEYINLRNDITHHILSKDIADFENEIQRVRKNSFLKIDLFIYSTELMVQILGSLSEEKKLKIDKDLCQQIYSQSDHLKSFLS